MNRQYLHEDIRQIRRYFPGARSVAMHTPFDAAQGLWPFDLTVGPVDRTQLLRDTSGEAELHPDWQGGLLWNR